MKTAIALALVLPAAAAAQVNLKFTPEPMAVPTAALSDARDMGRWIVEGCNDGNQTVNVAWERISMAAGSLRFIDSGDVLLVLTSNQQKSPAGLVVKLGTVAGQVAALGVALASKANWPLATGLSLGSSLAPAAAKIAQGEVGSIAPLTGGLTYPITLAPGACFTDHRFAAKVRTAAVVTATIEASRLVPVPAARPAIAPAGPAAPGAQPAASSTRHEPLLAFEMMAGPADIRRMAR